MKKKRGANEKTGGANANESYYNFTNELYCNLLSKNWGFQAPLGTYGRYIYELTYNSLIIVLDWS